MKTKSDGNWRGEKNEAKEEPLRVNNTRVTKFRTRTDYSRIEGNCNFAPTLLICLASAWEGGTAAILFLLIITIR